jgi:hypothetical protein
MRNPIYASPTSPAPSYDACSARPVFQGLPLGNQWLTSTLKRYEAHWPWFSRLGVRNWSGRGGWGRLGVGRVMGDAIRFRHAHVSGQDEIEMGAGVAGTLIDVAGRGAQPLKISAAVI